MQPFGEEHFWFICLLHCVEFNNTILLYTKTLAEFCVDKQKFVQLTFWHRLGITSNSQKVLILVSALKVPSFRSTPSLQSLTRHLCFDCKNLVVFMRLETCHHQLFWISIRSRTTTIPTKKKNNKRIFNIWCQHNFSLSQILRSNGSTHLLFAIRYFRDIGKL